MSDVLTPAARSGMLPKSPADAGNPIMANRPVTTAQLAKWDQITADAPLGPWRLKHYRDGSVETYAVESGTGPVCVLSGNLTEDPEDEPRREIAAALAFVAAARTAMPALFAEVRRLRGQDRAP